MDLLSHWGIHDFRAQTVQYSPQKGGQDGVGSRESETFTEEELLWEP